ncbi:hypothetical protein KEM52_002829 [Ascosphaera acerosa]|nr:hypothetical protein KEM52_002829 [Ascosphaera acerosa]
MRYIIWYQISSASTRELMPTLRFFSIMRILFMVPIYSVVSFLSLYFYRKSVYFEVLRDCYEAFAIASFFSLLCNYVGDDLHDQKNYFREAVPKPWMWPIRSFKRCCGEWLWRTPRSGLTQFNIIWVGVFQYCFIRLATTAVTVITEAFRKYCIDSNSPQFAHLWVSIVQAIAVTIAMYCLIQFYTQLKEDIAQHKPLLKLISIKLVIFLSFWQSIILNWLIAGGKIHPTKKIAYSDIKVAITGLLLTLEMALFSVLHFFAFSARPFYLKNLGGKAQQYQGGWFGILAWVEAFNPWDFLKAGARGLRWLLVGVRHRQEDPSYRQARPGYHRNSSAFSEGVDSVAMGDPMAPLAASELPPAGHNRHDDPYVGRFDAVKSDPRWSRDGDVRRDSTGEMSGYESYRPVDYSVPYRS